MNSYTLKKIITCLLFPITLIANTTIQFSNDTINENLAIIEECPKNSGLKEIDCIYFINLDKRPEKLAYMMRFLKKHKLNATRVHAVDGSLLSDESLKALRGPIHDPHVTRGSTGCALSHYSIWKHALEKGYDCVWVLEDDVVCVKSLRKLSKVINYLNEYIPDWDVLYTDPNTRDWDGSFFQPDYAPCLDHPSVKIKDPHYYLKRFVINNWIEKIRSRIGTYSMIYSRQGLQKIMSYHTKNDVWTHSDNSVHVTPNINQYVIRFPVVTHTIENRISDTAS